MTKKRRLKRKAKQKTKVLSDGCESEFEYVDIELLRIDYSYQRKPLSDRQLDLIIAVFDWVAFSTLLIGRRASGALFVVDGQQRLLAAKKIGIKRIPCFIFDSKGAKHEAKEFRIANTRRIRVTAIEKFNAAVTERKEPEIEIKHWLEGQGSEVTDAPVKCSVRFVGQLIKQWERNKEASKKAIFTQISIVGDDPLIGLIDQGLYWLEHNGVDTSAHIKKLILLGGKVAVCNQINKLRIELQGGKSPSDRIAGIAILKMINKGKRNKVGLHLLKV